MLPRLLPHRAAIAALALVAALLVPAAAAHADAAYEKVATAFAETGGHLDPCQFTQAELQAGLDGIPPEIEDVVPDLRKALRDGIDAHAHGACEGRAPGSTTNPDDAVSSDAVPPVTTTPEAPPTSTVPAQPAPTGTTAQPESAPTSGVRHDDRTALVVALIALGALALLALATWGWARMRGWDSTWGARVRHAWGEAGYRVSATWSEFGDWLRLGR
jgi:hypothetical protein